VLDGGITRTVRSGRVELAVVEGGDSRRPTVVFIHGYPDTKELWDDVLAQLGRRYHLIAYDVRGAGASSRPRGPAAYDLARLADDLEEVIGAVSPRRPVHLVGHDWGAIQGWEFVALERFRGKLASFTAIAGPPLDQALAGGGEREQARVRSLPRRSRRHRTPGRLDALPRRLRRSWYVVALCTPGVPTLTWRWLLAGPRWAWFLRNVERVGEKGSTPAATLAADGIHGSKIYRRNVPRRALRPRPDTVAHVPVQLVIPTRDHFISHSYYENADRLAPVLRRRVVGATHWVPRTEPGLIARWIAEFVDQVEAGEATGSRAPWVRGGGLDQLRGRLALVTGAASGIGRATAAALAQHGARVLLVDRDGSALQRVASEMGAAGTFVCDVSDERAMERLCDHLLGRFGVPDVVINNAGVGAAGPLLETSTREWKVVIGVNLMGVVHGCRLFGRAMVRRGEGGQIVNLASAAAFQPAKDLAAYAASKAAVLMLSECLRAELGPHGIGVTAVCPGFVNTNITRAAHYVGREEGEQRRVAERVTRLYERRNFTPEQVASEILEAIAVDAPVAVVTLEARVMRALARFAPSLRRRVAMLDTLPA
jgi:NAD(P)-dependent dehydrogenase (short-subunit alcohol dehydrogenase family)/pimeloyl-ACP methyl ester carboxylesterase